MADSTNKWKGVLIPALRKVQKQVQPTLTIHLEALVYLEELIVQLLHQLCSQHPHSIADVEERIDKSFPVQIKTWAIGSAQATIEKGKKKTLAFSVDKLQPLIHKEILNYKIDVMLAMYIIAVLEYISADILKLAGNYVKNIRHIEITAQDVKVAMYADKVLMQMFHEEDMESFVAVLQPLSKRGSLVYIEVLKDFMMSEEQYIRELNLIIKMFYQPMSEAKYLFPDDDLERIFSNITDIYDVTVQFYSMIETAFEMAGDNSGREPLIGDIVEEMAEAAEFEYYDTYAYDQASGARQAQITMGSYGRIKDILEEYEAKEFFKKKNLLDSVKYILPKLLYGPIYHCADYFEYFRLLMCTSPDGVDRSKLDEALSALRGLQLTIEKMCAVPPLKRTTEDVVFFQRKMGTPIPNSAAKISNIQDNIEGWEGKELSQIASLFLKEGLLIKPAQDGRKATERKVFLFDNLLVCTKQNASHRLSGFSQAEYRLKERIFLRKAEVIDRQDTEEMKHSFEVVEQLNATPIIFCCKDDETKFEWLSFLMILQYRSTLDRMLDVILQEEEQSINLRTPDSSVYRFAEEDSNENIIFEDGDDESGPVVIKGGTLVKLVERLTYHKYSDPTFIRVFLTTYRSFTSPVGLLDLLVKRYDIPEPLISNERNHSDKYVSREELKRFRKEFSHPIQLRVLNVLRHWTDQHFYDFLREESLLMTLKTFLSRVVRTKSLRKWVESIEKTVNRRLEATGAPEVYSFNSLAPPIEWHLTTDPNKFSILTLHPVEIGRQLTILQSEIFRSIKPSELVGSVWMKHEKEKLSPNALRMIRLSTLLTYWYEVSICEAHNFEERIAVYTRIIDILMVFIELNNFNGMMEILGALNSAPVHRLHFTAGELSPKRMQALQYVKELTDDGHHVKYTEKLRSINPPCVPFLGVYLSNILKAEEGNPDFLPQNDQLINFSKRRMVADITGEIQTYQNMPYNLQVVSIIRQFLEGLNPTQGRNDKEMNDYLFETSLIIEPRNEKPAKFTRKTEIPLKSPGIKAASRLHTVGRKSSATPEEPPTPSFERREPPRRSSSPTPSTVSTFSTFTIIEDQPDGKQDDLNEEEVSPPPILPERLPRLDEEISSRISEKFQTAPTPPAFPTRVTSKTLPCRSKSIDASVASLPPVLPPRSAKSLSSKQIFFYTPPITISDNEPPLTLQRPKQSETLPLVRERSTSDIGPPQLPSRWNKPPLLQRSSESSLDAMKGVSVTPPQLPPRCNKPVF